MRAAAIALLLMMVPSVAADDADATRTKVGSLVRQLASADEGVRKEAATRIVELGVGAMEQAARATAQLDVDGWRAFAEAVRAAERWNSPIPFVAAAHTAPDAHRERLLTLARSIDPRAGTKRETQEVVAIVREYLIDRRNEHCTSGHDTAVAVLGRPAVSVVLDFLRGPEREEVSRPVAYSALERIVEPEDILVLRELLLAGDSQAAVPLAHLQQRGVSEASEALLQAVERGHFDKTVAKALASTPDGARTVQVVRGWMAEQTEPTEEDHSRVADLFGRLGPSTARGTVEELEGWLAGSTESWAIASIATALTRLGSPTGVETLVRLVGEGPHGVRCTCKCKCCESKPAPEVPPGSLCAEGFRIWYRWPATKLLAEIAGPDVFALPSDDERRAARKADRDAGRDPETTEELVDRAAAVYRAWWDDVKQRIAFDEATGRWSVPR